MTDSDLREIVYRAVESDELDYKAHQSWNAMSRGAKAKIVRHLVALANTKGGYIVIGVGEDAAGYPAVYTGLTDEECRSFDPTAVGNFVAECVEPPVDFTIERPVIDGRRYAVFIVRPFAALPHVCSRGVENELRSGVFYIRTAAASSRPAYRAVEMHALIQRALRNQREMLGRMLRGLLYENRIEFSNPGTTLIPVARLLNAPPKTRNTKLVNLMRQMDLCEEGGTGWDLTVASCEAVHMAAPKVQSEDGLGTRVTLLGGSAYEHMTKAERRDAVYWHACLMFAQGESMGNQSLRERFGLEENRKNAVAMSRLIRDCCEAGLIKNEDDEAGDKYRRYVPYWA